jgi:PAS domain-containing protein
MHELRACARELLIITDHPDRLFFNVLASVVRPKVDVPRIPSGLLNGRLIRNEQGSKNWRSSRAELVATAETMNVMKFENRYRCKDGSYKWLWWTARAFDSRQLLYAVAREVTDSKKAEEALEKS